MCECGVEGQSLEVKLRHEKKCWVCGNVFSGKTGRIGFIDGAGKITYLTEEICLACENFCSPINLTDIVISNNPDGKVPRSAILRFYKSMRARRGRMRRMFVKRKKKEAVLNERRRQWEKSGKGAFTPN